MCAIVGMENYRKNINQYPFIVQLLGILLICHITFVSGQCKNGVVNVASCPSSDYAWSVRANEFCTQKEQYHCLITENYNQNDMDIIECCMEPHNITKGHMPRYSRSKNTIQEIECTGEYYMPVQFPSNKFRLYGVENCMYKKFMCNMSGMKVCSEGSKVSDRTCHCDYKNLYVAYLPLNNGDPCFMKDDNECVLTDGCSKPNQELNMYYNCVNVCAEGYHRPEMTADCRPFLPSTTTSTTEHVSSTIKSSTPSSDINKTVNSGTNEGMDSKYVIVLIICCSVVLLVVICIIYILSKSIKDKPNFEKPEASTYEFSIGENLQIGCHFEKGSRLYNVTGFRWLKYEMQSNVEPKTLSIDEIKYELDDEKKYRSLIINNLTENDSARYRCRMFYKCRFISCKKESTVDSKSITVKLKESTKPQIHLNNPENVMIGDNNIMEIKSGQGRGEDIDEEEKKPLIGKNTSIRLEQSYTVSKGKSKVIDVKIISDDKNFEFTKISWYMYKEGDIEPREIHTSEKGRFGGGRLDYPSLIIRKARMKDGGHYYCIGDGEHSIQSNRTFLVVNDKRNDTRVQNLHYINKVDKLITDKADVRVNTPTSDNSDDSQSTDSSDDDENSRENINQNAELGDQNARTGDIEMKDIVIEEAKQNNTDIGTLAQKFNYSVKDVLKDGNCLFHAASQQMENYFNPESHFSENAKELRRTVVDFLRNNSETPEGERYDKWLRDDESWESFLDRMSKDGEYGNEIILRAICHCYDINVHVLSTLNEEDFTSYKTDSEDNHTIYLGHEHKLEHYVILIPQGSDQTESSV